MEDSYPDIPLCYKCTVGWVLSGHLYAFLYPTKWESFIYMLKPTSQQCWSAVFQAYLGYQLTLALLMLIEWSLDLSYPLQPYADNTENPSGSGCVYSKHLTTDDQDEWNWHDTLSEEWGITEAWKSKVRHHQNEASSDILICIINSTDDLDVNWRVMPQFDILIRWVLVAHFFCKIMIWYTWSRGVYGTLIVIQRHTIQCICLM